MHRLRSCPLCRRRGQCESLVVQEREYIQCPECRLHFLAPERRLVRQEEYARYCQHNNDPSDPRYRDFLQPAVDVLLSKLVPHMIGLDYGCGPGPATPLLFADHHISIDLYDPYFAPNIADLRDPYDFIVSTETFEHFYRPAEELEKMKHWLKPTGYLLVMTSFFDDLQALSQSHYHRDPTHVVFFNRSAFQWIADTMGWSVEFPRSSIALFHCAAD